MRRCLGCIAFCAMALASPQLRAQDVVVSEYELKAAYLYHFLQFTDWPKSTRYSSEALQVCINRNNPMLRALKAIENKTAQGKKIVINIAPVSNRERCQVGILTRNDLSSSGDAIDQSNEKEILKQLPLLTISDDPSVSLNDTIIRMWIEDGRIVFAINNTRARERGLEISSKLLRLAGTVQ